MLPVEHSSQRMIAAFLDDTVSEPLPELCLRGPKLFTVPTNDKRGFLLPFSLRIVSAHRLSFDDSIHKCHRVSKLHLGSEWRKSRCTPREASMRGGIKFSLSESDSFRTKPISVEEQPAPLHQLPLKPEPDSDRTVCCLCAAKNSTEPKT
jgi:hypothetical protein